MIDFVPMRLLPGEKIIPVRVGQVLSVENESFGRIKLPMKVIKTYSNGDFDGEVEWNDS